MGIFGPCLVCLALGGLCLAKNNCFYKVSWPAVGEIGPKPLFFIRFPDRTGAKSARNNCFYKVYWPDGGEICPKPLFFYKVSWPGGGKIGPKQLLL